MKIEYMKPLPHDTPITCLCEKVFCHYQLKFEADKEYACIYKEAIKNVYKEHYSVIQSTSGLITRTDACIIGLTGTTNISNLTREEFEEHFKIID